jgi:hypothetical protein
MHGVRTASLYLEARHKQAQNLSRHSDGVRFPVGARDSSLPHSVQTDPGAHTDYPVGTEGSFLGGKAARD